MKLRWPLVVTLSLLASTAHADPPWVVSAQQQVAMARTENAKFLARFPRIQDVDTAIQTACASSEISKSMGRDFCSCGSAMTIMLWRALGDKDASRVTDRLRDYINGTGTMTAEDFLRYQGPELYGPVCSLAEDRLDRYKVIARRLKAQQAK